MRAAVAWRVAVEGSPVGSGCSPGWRNWQTRRTQNPLAVRSCGFKSRPGHWVALTAASLGPMLGSGGIDPPSLRKAPDMDTELNRTLISTRASDARAFLLFFAIVHTGMLLVLGLGSGLEDSGVQLGVAAIVVICTLMTFVFLDDCFRDLHACFFDVPAESLGENMLRRREAFSLIGFRVGALLMMGLVVVAELLAIY